MDKKFNAKLAKSKSSNSAITSKSEKGSSNKKSRSNVEFKALAGKKRGVYVEKRPSGSKQINAEGKNWYFVASQMVLLPYHEVPNWNSCTKHVVII